MHEHAEAKRGCAGVRSLLCTNRGNILARARCMLRVLTELVTQPAVHLGSQHRKITTTSVLGTAMEKLLISRRHTLY